MSFKVKSIYTFERQAKRLIKKFPSLKKEIFELIQDLKENPNQGTYIGGSLYKIRLAIASKGKGKSGGARVISYVFITEKEVYLLSIYDKSEKENLSDSEIKELLKSIP
jgi:hypothetical protein